nr:NADP-dependent malic enzyme-like isoform X2 [Ipomoea batatas]
MTLSLFKSKANNLLRKAALGVSPLCQRREVVMDSALKEISNGFSDNSGAGGGVRDIYGEDRATEDQTIIPWTSAVASGYTLMRDPHFNKGLAFTEQERDVHYLRGLLPPVVVSQELQVT